MALRYYRKLGTSSVPIPDGRSVVFKSIDGLQGFLSTDDPSLWVAFERCMAEGRSAISEITWSDFDAGYLQKKNSGQTLNQPWRDEIVRGRLIPSASELTARLNEAQVVAAVVSPPPPASFSAPAALAQPVVNAEIAKALPTMEDYKPVVGKRKRATK